MYTMVFRCVVFTRCCFFFFNDTATTEIYTLSLHDALPISKEDSMADHHDHSPEGTYPSKIPQCGAETAIQKTWNQRSEEHTSELQSQSNLVCRLLLEKKNNKREPINEIQRATTTAVCLDAD